MKRTIDLLLIAALLCALLFAQACSKKAGENAAANTTAAQTDYPAAAAEPTVTAQAQTEAQTDAQTTETLSSAAPQNSEPDEPESLSAQPQTSGNTAPAAQDTEPKEYRVSTGKSGGPAITVFADRAGSLHAGDRFTLTFHVSNAVYFVCLSARMEYDAALLTAEDYESTGEADLMDSLNVEAGQIRYAGLVMKTADISDADLFSVTFTVNRDCGSTVAEITTEITQYLSATDASGDKTLDLTGDFSPAVLAIRLAA